MKVLLTATVQSHICQFHKPLVEVLHAHGCEVHVAARDNLAEKNGLKLDFVEKVYDVPFARSPKSPDNLKAYKQLKEIIDSEHYDVIHCNTPMGGIVTRLAARKARKQGTKVIYMAHGFHFYKGASRKNWLVFYPIERIMARMCDAVITINEEDYAFAKAKFHTRVEHLHGVGVSEERYHPVSPEESSAMRAAEGLTDKDFVILCTGELNKNKDQKTLIAAAGSLKDKIPNLKVLLAGNGPLEAELREQIRSLELEQNVKLLGYRTDLEKVLPCVDLVVSCSHREGLGLNVIEAMLCKKPVVATVNRGHRELICDGENGYLVPYGDSEQMANRCLTLLEDENLYRQIAEGALETSHHYGAQTVKAELEQLYFG